MKKIVSCLLVLAMMVFGLSACGLNSDETGSQDKSRQSVESKAEKATSAAEESDVLSGKHHATIEVEKYGTISVELDADIAPITVTNFVNLAKQGFYDGLTFHRIMDGFMIQGGDPTGTGAGGSDQKIKGEFQANGVENNLSHKRGVISMARATDYDSASSQFFIVQADSDFLDGEYAAFGNVTEGMEIVDQICEDTPVEDNNGTVLSENQPKITKVEVVD